MTISSVSSNPYIAEMMANRTRPMGPPKGMEAGETEGNRPPPISDLVEGLKSGEVTVTENDDGTLTINDGEKEFTVDLEEMQARHEEVKARMEAQGATTSGYGDRFSEMDELIGTLIEITA